MQPAPLSPLVVLLLVLRPPLLALLAFLRPGTTTMVDQASPLLLALLQSKVQVKTPLLLGLLLGHRLSQFRDNESLQVTFGGVISSSKLWAE